MAEDETLQTRPDDLGEKKKNIGPNSVPPHKHRNASRKMANPETMTERVSLLLREQ